MVTIRKVGSCSHFDLHSSSFCHYNIYTLGENIADNGGMKQAYNAYNRWIERNGPEDILPGLKCNPQQLFWILAAQIRCSASTSEHNKLVINNDEHSPNDFRVNGVISNMRAFALDFNCAEETKMNPKNKCEVW